MAGAGGEVGERGGEVGRAEVVGGGTGRVGEMSRREGGWGSEVPGGR